jgi:hypothetical protein
VSATLANPAWNNSTVLKGDVLNEVSTLKLKIFPVAPGPASACSARPATANPCASSTPRPSRAASPTSPTDLSGTPSGARRR